MIHLTGNFSAFFASFSSLALPALALVACSSSSTDQADAGSRHSGGYTAILQGGSPTTGGGTSVGTGGTSSNVVAACQGLPYSPNNNTAGGGGVCVGTGRAVEASLLDVYIMQDRTQSMTNPTSTGTRWSDLANAVAAFVGDPQTAAQDIQVGIQFFSKSGGFNNTEDCDPEVYATPAVEIGPVGTTGPAIVTAIQNTVPSGQTPSVPALQGAVHHAIEWQDAHPARQTIVLLVTDGFPTMCEPLANADVDLVNAVKAGMDNSPPIRTYVIGVAVGASVFRLRDIALYGGSNQPYLVEDTNARQGLIDAFRNITRNPLPCEYPIPTPPNPLDEISYDQVQVVHTTTDGKQEEVPYANTQGGCSQAYGGWYYDIEPSRGKPTKIRMCPCTCSSFGAGSVDIYLGCHPQITGLG